MTTAPTGPSGPAGPGPGRDFTGPTQPPPRPLPNPGPPPAPGGRLPIGAPCDCGHGDLPQSFHLSPCPKARPLRPQPLAQMVNEVTRGLEAAIFFLGRQWDPTSGPCDQEDPWGPESVDIHLGSAVADIRSAIRELADITSQIPARQSTNSASLPGGPPNHPVGRPDEGLTPGLDAGGANAHEGSDAALAGALAGSSHLAPAPLWASGDGRTSGHAEAAARQQVVGESPESPAAHVGLRAGASSGPRPVARSAGPDGPGRVAGVGFKLPPAKRWPW